MKRTSTRILVECSMMLALATVLSMLKLVEMPYGGSVTLASMLPILIVAYRHGVRYGLLCGACYALMQQLLGLKNLSYFTTWYSVVAVIVLDYLLAFVLIGLGGAFRKKMKSQSLSLFCGCVLVCVVRYVLHTLSGATVWAGLSIPSEAALVYSLGYNATYMLPETIILCAVAYYLGGMIDFSREMPTRMRSSLTQSDRAFFYVALSGLCALTGLIVEVCLIFPQLQMEDGSFSLSGLGSVPWGLCAVIAVASVAITAALYRIAARKR